MSSEVSAKEFTNVLEEPSPDGFSIFPATLLHTQRKTALPGGVLLFLNLLVDFAGSRVGIELLKFNLAFYLLLILAGTANVPRGRTQQYETIL